MRAMDRFEQFANWLSDRDAEWWPFLFMRPARERRMTTLRVAALAILYGVFAGMFTNAWVALAGKAGDVHVLAFPVGITGAFFVVFRLTFAFAWNRRAARMKKHPGLDAFARTLPDDASDDADPTDV